MAREKNTLIYSRKAYNLDIKFAKNVEKTQQIANSQEDHIELLEKLYPTYTIEPLYTFEHGCMLIERTRSCRFDSSADAFCAYKKEEQLVKKIKEINENLYSNY